MTKARELSDLGSLITITGSTANLSNLTVSGNLQVSAVVANGTLGTDSQVLTSNGTVTYWAAPAAGVNTSALYTWSNVHTFTSNVLITNADKLVFEPVAGGSNVHFTQQSDDNFVMYSSNTTNGTRPIWSVYANSLTSNLNVLVALQLSSGLVANGSLGTDGQVLVSNGSTTYWSRIPQRVVTIADGTSITMNCDSTDVAIQINTQAAGTLTINAPTGTPVNGQKLMLRIKCTNVQTLSSNVIFAGSTDLALPTTTSGASKTDYLGFQYDSTATKWHMIAKNFGF